MNNATRATVSAFGVLAGLAGIEHGVGEVLQGKTAPSGVVISSWPGSEVFGILAGEPAMTLVPNLLATGILAVLAVLVSVTFLLWVTVFVGTKHGGLGLILLSLALLLVGGGFGPPVLGFIIGLAAARMNTPLDRRRTYLSDGPRRFLAGLWPWSFAAAVIAWLSLLPGTVLLDQFVGVSNTNLVVAVLTLSAFGLLLLRLFAGLARDAQRQKGSHRAHPVSV
ncbi:MAG TPA: hypothetical protein VHM69_01265 [Rubrobacter sp.]|nr:hypothetical protein [Rubrobacter sp.]